MRFIIQKVKSFLSRLKHDKIVRQYVRYGLIYGDYMSYYYCPPRIKSKFLYWESQYIKLGYIPLTTDDWIIAGGYGKQYKHLLRIRYEAPQ